MQRGACGQRQGARGARLPGEGEATRRVARGDGRPNTFGSHLRECYGLN